MSPQLGKKAYIAKPLKCNIVRVSVKVWAKYYENQRRSSGICLMGFRTNWSGDQGTG